MSGLMRRNAAGMLLASLHSAGVLAAWYSVAANRDTFLNGIQWIPVAVIDFPVSLAAAVWEDLFLDAEPTVVGLIYLIGGEAYWLLIGAVARAAWRRFMRWLETA